MSPLPKDDILSDTLFGRTRSAVLALLFGHVDDAFYLRQLVRTTRCGQGAVQREVKQLSDAGLLVRSTIGNQTFYRANRDSPVFPEIRNLITKTVGLHDVLRAALTPVREHIQAAFVYGSVARHEETSSSDIDLLVIGDLDFGELVSRLEPAQKKLGREINPTLYPVPEFRAKVASHHHFLTSVLNGTKLFIFGDESELGILGKKRMARKTQE